MRKRCTVGELKRYCSQNEPHRVSFVTENQPDYTVSDPCKVQYTFPTMLVYENPSIVCLKSGDNTVCFDRVKFAEVDTESSVLGTIIQLFCGSQTVERSYILVVA